ncbi:hypothetical protein B0H13DRAFT_1874104 [Mycena leptocephala]|nr:hypothetical protein B0H13DRAFT_1874104 [Mycena leptocephala]
MQYTVDSERFDGDWDSMTQLLLEMGMAVTIAETVVQARLVQQDVRAQVLNEHESISRSAVLAATRSFLQFVASNLYRCYVIWGFRKKIVIMPMLLMLSTLTLARMALTSSCVVMGIVGATAFSGAVNDMPQITYALAAATDLVLTALTGKLESGAIYCIGAIFLVITVSLDSPGIYGIGVGISRQMLNIIPTFTLVYVGLNNPDYSQHSRQVPSTRHASSSSAVVLPSHPCEVLDIKPQLTEGKDGECI